MIVLGRDEIERRLDRAALAPAIETAFIAASGGNVSLPPVTHLEFPEVGGDCHVKTGHRRGDPVFVIKVATGFPQNTTELGPVNNGVSLVLSAETGAVVAVLHDEMRMTDVRTGVGGAVATRALARPDASRLLIVGTGIQATEQILAHRAILDRGLDIEVWGRSAERAARVADTHDGVRAVEGLADACARADIIVTVTAAREPLVHHDWIAPGTHITALGADAPGKHELDPGLVFAADLIVADKIDQCRDHGELSVDDGSCVVAELGHVLAGTTVGRTSPTQITIADLTGIAAQDIAVAAAVLDV